MKAAVFGLIGVLSAVPAEAATVIVNVEGVEASSGEVSVGLCDTGLSIEGCPYFQEKPATTGSMEFRFEDIPPGRYAVASYHDVNGNGKFDRILKVPREPWGISKDGGGGLWPEFDESVVPVRDGETKITVRLRRLLD